MKHLQDMIDQQNRWAALMNTPEITMPLSQEDIKSLANSIESGLSPENLACDGEASRAHIRREGKRLNNAKNELAQYAGITVAEVEKLAWGEWA